MCFLNTLRVTRVFVQLLQVACLGHIILPGRAARAGHSCSWCLGQCAEALVCKYRSPAHLQSLRTEGHA